MGYITKYGSFWGELPTISGRVFWIAPSATYTIEGRSYVASDDNDGLSPERAVLTLAHALSLGTSNVGDVFVLLPGTHTMATVVTVSLSGITITGIPQGRQLNRSRGPADGSRNRSKVTAAASTDTINITGTDVEICYLHFTAVSGQRSISLSNAADRAHIHNNTFDSQVTGSLATICIGLNFSGTGTTTTLDDVHIHNNFFINSDANGGMIEAANTCTGLFIDSNTFYHRGATALANCILFGTGISKGVVVRDNDLIVEATGTTVTDFVDAGTNTVDGSNTVLRCYVPVGGGAFNVAATADGIVVDSYTAGSTGTGTVLATS